MTTIAMHAPSPAGMYVVVLRAPVFFLLPIRLSPTRDGKLSCPPNLADEDVLYASSKRL
jgi:hypothetical protein